MGTPSTRLARLIAVTWVTIGFFGPIARAVDVTCGDTVPAGQIGDVVADADCTGASLVLESGATLRLNGHTIQGTDPNPPVCFPYRGECSGVLCLGASCRVEGPGTIEGFSAGIFGRGAPEAGRVKVIVSNLTLRLNTGGISSDRAVVTDVVASDNLVSGINADTVRVRRVEASRNGAWGLYAGKISGIDVVTASNGLAGWISSAGVVATRARFKRLTATENLGEGIRAERVTLRDGVLTGNVDGDLSTAEPPRLRGTTCETSSDQQGGTWGVCSLD